jgi:energy-coupling factor transporter ATP-binding protein EcfA2
MTVLDAVIEFARELPGWQADAVRRLLTQDALSEKDKGELLSMLKAQHGLASIESLELKPRPPQRGDISGAPEVTAKVKLKAMKDLSNVNAIEDGSKLLFGHEGLTIIYGENAAGKSGYARVLKRACRARDTKERILPNVNSNKTHGPASATFKFSINDGEDKEEKWVDGEGGPDVLTNIAVFDRKCARVIVDENNKAEYLPYGAHIFTDLVNLLREFRERLNQEKPEIQAIEYNDIPSQTEAGQLLLQINLPKTSYAIEKFAKWASSDEKVLIEIERQIAKSRMEDPIRGAAKIRAVKGRLIGLSQKIDFIHSTLSDERVESLKQTITNLDAAEKALKQASSESLADEPLPIVGGETWRKMYDAAKEYSVLHAYPKEEFPYTGSGSLCPLCMQPLSEEAIARFQRFERFMEQKFQTEVKMLHRAIKDKIDEISGLDFTIVETYGDAIEEIRRYDDELPKYLAEYCAVMAKRASDMVNAVNAIEFGSRPDNPAGRIVKVTEKLENEASEFEKLAGTDEIGKLEAQRDELLGRKLLTQRKDTVLKQCDLIQKAQKYEACISETSHKGITQRGNEIVSASLTEELDKALRKELSDLNVRRLNIILKDSGQYGETSHKIELAGTENLKGVKLTEILSEGEQNVVALAGFLAELSLGGNSSPIVLDDPVCSLDHKYRDKVAERLAMEGCRRRVIIFTHDIAFLLELERKAGLHRAKVIVQTIRFENQPGRCDEGVPWETMNIKRRISFLLDEWGKISKLYDSDLSTYNKEAAHLYGLLRETWEAAVEEVLLSETVRRHSSEVHTQKLRYVTVTNEDYNAVYEGMSKCSNWMFGHDKAKGLDINRPSPGELHQDIEALQQFMKQTNSRNEILRREREAIIKPQEPEIG